MLERGRLLGNGVAENRAATEYVLIDFENVQPKNLEEAELLSLIDELKQRRYIAITEGKVSYQLGK